MPPNVLKTPFMLQRWLEDRQLTIEILYKRAKVSRAKSIQFIENNDGSVIKFNEVVRLQQAAIEIDHELFQYIYDSWV